MMIEFGKLYGLKEQNGTDYWCIPLVKTKGVIKVVEIRISYWTNILRTAKCEYTVTERYFLNLYKPEPNPPEEIKKYYDSNLWFLEKE